MCTRVLSIQRMLQAIRDHYVVVLRGFVLLTGAVVTALACGWGLYTDHSVRFNTLRKDRGFYRLPPLPIMYDSDTGKGVTVAELEESGRYEDQSTESVSESPDTSGIWNEARAAVQRGDLTKAKALLNKFLTATAFMSDDELPSRQQRRNSAYDMLDAMTALAQGTSPNLVKDYLEARYAYHNESRSDAVELLNKTKPDKNLRDNWDYLKAALVLSESNDAALNAFQDHTVNHPRSEKNEAALYMIAKLIMEASYSFANNECDVSGPGETVDQAKIEKCKDENWHKAAAAFKQLIRKYPRGRYFNDSRGWLAYLYRRGGESSLALAEYYRLLGDKTDLRARLDAKKSLQLIGHEHDDTTLDRVEELLADDADAALAYTYHRIYNQAVDLTYQEKASWIGDDYDEKYREEKRVADARHAGKHELERVAKFASAMMKRHPNARVSGAFVLRVAQAHTELENYEEALRFAPQALSLGLQGELRAQALWIKGCAEHRLKGFKTADSTFRQLIAEFPKSKLTEGARRLLAITAEDRDDLETALKLYLDLNYAYDIAYFIDVLMPTDRLAGFVAKHSGIAQHDQMLYALGVRYMRDRRWNEARATLQKVRTKPGPLPSSFIYYENDKDHDVFAKEPEYSADEDSYIHSSWVAQDLKTIDSLERLERVVESAEGDEAKAEAMYQLASYQFDAHSLLFYNPAAWGGSRYWLLSDIGDSDRFRLPNEWQILFKYSESHETLARAIPVYLEIADRFPQTKAARDALYSAAVANEQLSNLNPYWRSVYERGVFVGSRQVTYKDVKRAYPSYQLPRGTNGWEASTRTVNGGPGWTSKPKPPPKLTRAQKIEQRLGGFVESFWTTLADSGERISTVFPAVLREFIFAFLTALLIWSAIWIRVWRRN